MRLLEIAASWKIQSHPGGGESYFSDFVKNVSRICETDVIVARNEPRIESTLQADIDSDKSHIFAMNCSRFRFQKLVSTMNPIPSFLSKDWKNLDNILECGAYDILHIHNFRTWTASAFVLRASRHYSKKRERPLFVLSDHGALSFPFPKLLIRQFDALASPSDTFNRFYSSIAQKNIPTLKLGAGIDHDLFNPKYCEKTYDIISVGRIADWKGLDVLINSAALAQVSIGRKLRLAHVGITHDSKYRNHLLALSSRNGVEIELLGRIAESKLPLLYNQSKILVFPSKQRGISLERFFIRHKSPEEQLGMAVLEAMSCGTPAIVSDLGALPETVKHGEDGFVFPANNIQALAYFISQLISNEDLRKKLSANALSRAISEFDWTKVTANFVMFCSKLRAHIPARVAPRS